MVARNRKISAESRIDAAVPQILELDELIANGLQKRSAAQWTMSQRMDSARAALRLGPLLAVHGVANGRCTCPQGGRCTKAGKHPATRNGSRDATTDEAQIEEWLRAGYNIGLTCEGLLVLDIDPRNGGHLTLKSLEDRYGKLPETVSALTGGDGRHEVFRLPEGLRAKKSAGEGLDIKSGSTAYILVQPSRHRSQKNYHWIRPPDQFDPGNAPQWLLELATRRDEPRTMIPTGAVSECLLGRVFAKAGMVFGERNGKLLVRCPWDASHTTRSGPNDSSTVIFAPTQHNQCGKFFCSHGHCAERTLADVLGAVDQKTVAYAIKRQLMQRAGIAPPSINFNGEKIEEPKNESPTK